MNTITSQVDSEVKTGAMAYLPVALFGSVMGLSGLSIAWRMAHARFDAPQWIGECIGYVAMLSFVFLVAGYAIKLTSSFASVRM